MFFRLMQLIKPIFPSVDLPLIRLSMFHDKRGPVFVALKTITELLKKHQIDYAVIGGVAVYKHGYERSTNDCDFLLTKDGLKQFQQTFVGRYVKPKFEGAQRSFICNKTKTPIDIIVEGEFPGKGEKIPVAFPDPKTCCQLIDGVSIIWLSKLIELKLASSKTLPIGRSKDKADVVELIKANKAKNLDKSFAGLLHPYVRSDFIDIVDGLEREKI